MGASQCMAASFMTSPMKREKKSDVLTSDEIVLNEARYVLSLVCFELARYDECEEFLLGKKWSDSRSVELCVPNGVFGVYLLAKVFHFSSRFELAVRYYRECVQMDSFHFGAISALAELGKDPGLSQSSSEDGDNSGVSI